MAREADDDLGRLLGAPGTVDRRRLTVDAASAASELLGLLLVREDPAASTGRIVARIVETEAYHQSDPASHSHRGRTARAEPMFWQPGTAYVYRSYGVHWCLNVSVEPTGTGAAVLLRAAVVLEGSEAVAARRRGGRRRHELLRGPGNLTAGLDLDGPRHDRGDLVAGVAGLRLADDGWRPKPARIAHGPRVGVSAAADRPWRRYLHDVRAVSAYRRSPRAHRG